MQRGLGVDKGIERLVAFAVAFGLPGADRTAAIKAGDNARPPSIAGNTPHRGGAGSGVNGTLNLTGL